MAAMVENASKQKQRYNKKLFDEFCKTNNIILAEKYEKISSKTKMVGKYPAVSIAKSIVFLIYSFFP